MMTIPFALNRVHCGDALELFKRLPDGCVDFIFTDPPYGHNNNNGDLIENWEKALGRPAKGVVAEARPIANDGAEANDLVRAFFSEAKRLLRPGSCCCCCCCGGGGPDPQFARWSLWMDELLGFKMAVVWDKGPMGMGWHYRRSWECVLVGMKPGGPCKWYDESSAVENIIRPGQYGIRKIIPSAAQHPTEKPVALAAHFIRLHTMPGDVVLDPFAGHGSTGVAAISQGRKFLGFELSEEFQRIADVRVKSAERGQTVEQYRAGQGILFEQR